MLELVEVTPLRFQGGPARENEYLLSPYVFANGREIFVRAVPRLDDEPERKISRAFHGRSSDGIAFELDEEPAIVPGPDAFDIGGVEDPTVVEDDGTLHVFYSGWDGVAGRSTMLRATGPNAGALVKCGPVLPADALPAKEPTLTKHADGWTMFYEIERDDASLNASATAPALTGPWTLGDDVLRPRAERFDAWHLSPIAFVRAPAGTQVLLYNGATRDARWQIGWCSLDETCGRVLARSDAPVIEASRNAPDQRELAFGASVVATRDGLYVYYSIADTDPARATLRWRM